MAVILFSEPSTVMVVAEADPAAAVWTMEVPGDLAAVLHVARPVARRSKLPPVLEMPEAILQEV
jgi:hypothetical protein